jgi:AcrR family transcriptional regulator
MRKRGTGKSSLHEFRRGEIVAAAREIVAGSGLEALTIGALEKRLGFTRGVITYHFDDKDEIVEAVFASALGEIEAATQTEAPEAATAIDRVRALLRAYLQSFVDHREAGTILLSFSGRLGSDPKARKATARLHEMCRERALSVLDSGDFQFVDSLSLATVIVGLVLGIASQVYVDPGTADPEGALNEAMRCVVARLTGASPRP